MSDNYAKLFLVVSSPCSALAFGHALFLLRKENLGYIGYNFEVCDSWCGFALLIVIFSSLNTILWPNKLHMIKILTVIKQRYQLRAHLPIIKAEKNRCHTY